MTDVAVLLRSPATAVWCVLVAATTAAWILGTEHGITDHTYASLLILLIAFIKVRLVGLYFMELKDAPMPLRTMFEAYCLTIGSAVIAVFLFA